MTELTHPFLIHIPLGIMWLLPILIILAINSNHQYTRLWLSVMAATLLMALFSYLAVYTGEMGEHILEGKINKEALEEHEEAGELFALLCYILFGLSIVAYFLKEKLQKILQYLTLALACFIILAGMHAGSHGGDLVYKHGAAELLKEKSIQKDHRKEDHGDD